MGNYTSLRRHGTDGRVLSRRSDVARQEQVLYRSIDEVTPVYFAIRNGNLRDVENCIIEHGQDVNSPIPGMLQTPMSVAAQSSNAVLEKFIRSHNGDANSKDGNGSTPLIVASRSGNLEAVRLLTENGADLNAQSEVEDIPRVIKRELESMDSMEMIEDLLKCISQSQPADASEYRCRFLNDLLKHAAAENILAHELLEPYMRNTALIQASREHHTRVVSELLSKGADINRANSAGNTALHVACGSLTADPHRLANSSYIPSTLFIGPNTSIVQRLIDHGAGIRLRNNQGETPIHRLSRIGQLDHPLCYHEWQLHASDVSTICYNTFFCMGLLLRAGSAVPSDEAFFRSLWTLGEKFITGTDLSENTQLFISVMKMIKLCSPHLSHMNMLLDDSNIVGYPTLSELQTFVADHTKNPFRLQDLCRIVIRNELQDSPYHACKELPVPPKLKDFILFETL